MSRLVSSSGLSVRISISGLIEPLLRKAVQVPPDSTPTPPTELRSTSTRSFQLYTQMSTRNQTTDPSISNFTAIFDAAAQEYKTLTKNDLTAHPFAAAIEDHNSPDSILNVFRNQARAFDAFRKGDEKLMALLTPIVNILFTFSESLGEGVGLVSLHSVQYIAVL